MAEVTKRAHVHAAYAASRSPTFKGFASRYMADVKAVARRNVDTSHFLNSIDMVQGRVDWHIYTTDPAALSIEYGHTAENGRFVPGMFAFTQAMDKARARGGGSR